MKILFLTTGTFGSINDKGLYPDLLREFTKGGHDVYIVSAREKREGFKTELVDEGMAKHLMVKIGNITKTSFIEKGISTILISSQYKRALCKHLVGVKFDLILYSTPPITLGSLVSFIKNRDNAITYLILKDIFPQNAVDLNILEKSGLKGFLYKYFRRVEKQLYNISDYIGCMSQANVDYILKFNPELDKNRVQICPNSIEIQNKEISLYKKRQIRDKYGIPGDKLVFVYGGNLGKPQGIPFLIECLKSQINNEKAFFLIVGNGTEYKRLSSFFKNENPSNMKLMQRLPKEDYETMIAACDIGMIFLDYRFTIPNFPSRLLSYMQAKLPVLAVTDPYTDLGKVIIEGEFGWWCESNSVKNFREVIHTIFKCDKRVDMGKNGWEYLHNYYTSDRTYRAICNQIINQK